MNALFGRQYVAFIIVGIATVVLACYLAAPIYIDCFGALVPESLPFCDRNHCDLVMT